MTLTEGIKDIITRFGDVSIATKQFINLLDDVGAFKDEPAASKKVMRGLLASGFGELLYQVLENKPANWQNLVRKCVSEYTVQSGYKDELINHHASCLLYGAGVIDELYSASADGRLHSEEPAICGMDSFHGNGANRSCRIQRKKHLGRAGRICRQTDRSRFDTCSMAKGSGRLQRPPLPDSGANPPIR